MKFNFFKISTRVILTIIITTILYGFYIIVFLQKIDDSPYATMHFDYSELLNPFVPDFYIHSLEVVIFALPFFGLFYRQHYPLWRKLLLPTILSTIFYMSYVIFLAFGWKSRIAHFYAGISYYPIFYIVYTILLRLFNNFSSKK